MFTTSNTSNVSFSDKLFTEANKDVSVRPPWFIKPSGLDLFSVEIVEYPESGTASTNIALRFENDYIKVAPSPRLETVFVPKTELASRLWEIRKLIIASGEPLLDWDGVQKEISLRRAERE